MPTSGYKVKCAVFQPTDSMAHPFNDRGIMRNKQVTEASFYLNLFQEPENLGLDRKVKRRCGLIQNNQLRFEQQYPGQGDPLIHPSGQLAWKITHEFSVQTNLGAGFPNRLQVGFWCAFDQLSDLKERFPNGFAGIERTLRVLEHHLYPGPDTAVIQSGKRLLVKIDLTCCRPYQTGDDFAQRGFPDSGSSHDSKGLSGGNGQADILEQGSTGFGDSLDPIHSDFFQFQ
jgi:hypothetical protein